MLTFVNFTFCQKRNMESNSSNDNKLYVLRFMTVLRTLGRFLNVVEY